MTQTQPQHTGWQPQPPMLPPSRQRTRPSWLLWAALWALTTTIAVAALVVALTAHSGTPSAAHAAPAAPTSGEVAAAKAKACQAVSISDKALRMNTNRPGATSPDDSLGWANTAIARTSLVTVATYLPTQIDPATPQDIADAARAFASAASEDAISSQAEYSEDSSVDKALTTLQVAAKEAARVCHE